MWHNEDIINYITPQIAGKTCWYAWSPVVWGFLVQIFVSWLLKSPILKVVNFQSTGQSMATARSPADSNNKQGSVFVIFVVQMDNNAAHARLLMTNEECGWHMLISKCRWKLICSHLQYILFHHQCIHNSLPSTSCLFHQHIPVSYRCQTLQWWRGACVVTMDRPPLLSCAAPYFTHIPAISSNRPFNTTN